MLSRFTRSLVPLCLIASSVLLALSSAPAGATGTNLLTETFANGTTNSQGWVLPTGSNGVCLTAGTNTSATPLPDCNGVYQGVNEPIDANGSGALQLTNNGGGQVGTVYNGVAIPTANGLDISWTSYQFNGNGADGISFDLAAVNPANPTSPATTGPSGGSLGYSTYSSTAGVPFGYLGFGADVYGNYESSGFGSSSCGQSTSAQAESLGVRGPGNGTTGYCLLANQQLTGRLTLDKTSATTRGSGSTSVGVPEEVVLNTSSTAITASKSGVNVPAGDWLFAVKPLSSGTPGTTWKVLEGALPTHPTGVSNSWLNSTTGLPQELAFGWAASTGGANEFHQINQLQVASLTASPSLSLTNTDSGGGVIAPSSTASVTLTPSVPTSSAVSESQPIIVTDTFSSALVPTAASGTGWTCTVTSPTVSCQFTPSSAVAAGTILPPITVTATASGSPGPFTDTATATSQDAAPASATDSGSIRGTQTISYTSSAPTSAVVGGSYPVSATSTSGLAVAITVDPSSAAVCSISGATVTLNGGGTCTLDANQAGNTNYSPATEVQQSFAVAKHSQTVAFTSTAPTAALSGGATYSATATSTSGLAVTLTVDASSSSVCSISSGTVSFHSGGVCTLDVNQAGNATYAAATQAQQAFIVAQTQKIVFGSIAPTAAQAGGTYNVTAASTSGLATTLSIDPSSASICSISGGTVTFTTVGTCVIDANQAGGTNGGFTYIAAPQARQSFVIQVPTVVTFTTSAPTSAVVGVGSYTPAATASSGTAPTIAVDASSSSVCSISGGIVTFIGGGVCRLDATGGTGPVTSYQSFSVAATQTITFTSVAPSSAIVSDTTYSATATATSGLGVTLSVDGSSSTVCSISGGAVSFNASGICTLDANQAGGTNGSLTYTAALQVQQSFAVQSIAQTVSFSSSAPTSDSVGGTSYTPTASATSTLAAAITVDTSSSAVCSISGGGVSLIGGGVCTLDANQPGNTVYAAATQVQQSFAVAPTPQTIAFTSAIPTSVEVGGATYAPTASATSSLSVTITVDPSSSAVCSISGGVVSFTGSGVCTLDANQSGNTVYAVATQVQQAFVVAGVAQTISFASTPPSFNQIGATYNVTASSTSGLAVTISVDPSSSGVCSITGGVVTSNADGICLLDANQAGDTTYPPATQVTQAFNVGSPSSSPSIPQSISITSTPLALNQIGGTYNVTTTSTSSLGVVVSVSPSSSGVCSISGATVTFISNGICTIDANQAGNTIYLPAAQVSQDINVGASINVGLKSQTIVFTSKKPGDPKVGSAYRPTATGGNSGKPVTFSIGASTTSGCRYDANTGLVTFASPQGSCVIDANQAGTSTYEAAPQAFQLIEIGGSSPMSLTIYFANNSWVLSTSSKSQLHTLAIGMKAKGLTNVTITGYASSTGASTNNNVLGTHRAEAAAAYLKALLVKLGVKKTAIAVSGKGASNFVAYPSSVATNRRASIRAT